MAITSGMFLHDANGFVIDRIQSGGVSSLNIPEEKIYELGNYQTVATIRDIPDLSFDLESFDMSTEIEAVLTGVDPTSTTDGDEFDLTDSIPLDVISPFKAAKGLYNIVKGVIVPYLTLESATYRFGNRQSSTQSFTLRGDSVYYIPGTPYYEEFAGDNSTTVFSFAHTAIPYEESGDTLHALSVCVIKSDGTYRRLFYGEDYTDSTTQLTLAAGTLAPASSTIRVVYGSLTAATYSQQVHQTVSVKPAAVRGKDIDVYVGTTPVNNEVQTLTEGGSGLTSFTITYGGNTTGSIADGATSAAVQTALRLLPGVGTDISVTGSAGGPYTVTFTGALAGSNIPLLTTTPTGGTGTMVVATVTQGSSATFTRWAGVQSFEVSRKVNLENDEEFGNHHYVSQDYNTADVTGSVVVKSKDLDDLWAKIHQVANVTSTDVVGPNSSVGLPVEIRVSHPDTGDIIKTLYIPDARFTVPALQGRANQKLETTFSFTGDSGTLLVYQGERPAPV